MADRRKHDCGKKKTRSETRLGPLKSLFTHGRREWSVKKTGPWTFQIFGILAETSNSIWKWKFKDRVLTRTLIWKNISHYSTLRTYKLCFVFGVVDTAVYVFITSAKDRVLFIKCQRANMDEIAAKGDVRLGPINYLKHSLIHKKIPFYAMKRFKLIFKMVKSVDKIHTFLWVSLFRLYTPHIFLEYDKRGSCH